jgi:hypothetical protein
VGRLIPQGDVRRKESVQRLSAALNGTLGSYLRDTLQEQGSADVVALLPSSSLGLGLWGFPPFSFLLEGFSFFLIRKYACLLKSLDRQIVLQTKSGETTKQITKEQ